MSADKKLWDNDHFGNFPCGRIEEFDNWDDWLAEYGKADSWLIYWNWTFGARVEEIPSDDRSGRLDLYWLHRRGVLILHGISVCKNDEPSVRAFLSSQWEYMTRQWEPVS